METFLSKSYPVRIVSAFFALGSIASPLILHTAWYSYLLSGFFIIAAFLCWRVPLPRIEVDELGIKRLQQDGRGGSLPQWLLHPETGCEWRWIASVSTTRMENGSFLTVLTASEEHKNQAERPITVESALFRDYVRILSIIKGRATGAHFDEMTDSILKGKTDLRPVRPLFLWIFVIVVLGAFLYAIYSKG